jgi:hypothetical protein
MQTSPTPEISNLMEIHLIILQRKHSSYKGAGRIAKLILTYKDTRVGLSFCCLSAGLAEPLFADRLWQAIVQILWRCCRICVTPRLNDKQGHIIISG